MSIIHVLGVVPVSDLSAAQLCRTTSRACRVRSARVRSASFSGALNAMASGAAMAIITCWTTCSGKVGRGNGATSGGSSASDSMAFPAKKQRARSGAHRSPRRCSCTTAKVYAATAGTVGRTAGGGRCIGSDAAAAPCAGTTRHIPGSHPNRSEPQPRAV